jgi:hypothetical protein
LGGGIVLMNEVVVDIPFACNHRKEGKKRRREEKG